MSRYIYITVYTFNILRCFLQAIIEEADMRLGETKKSHYEFERDIVKGAVNPRTNKVIAEKVTRYFEDKMRSRVSVPILCT